MAPQSATVICSALAGIEAVRSHADMLMSGDVLAMG